MVFLRRGRRYPCCGGFGQFPEDQAEYLKQCPNCRRRYKVTRQPALGIAGDAGAEVLVWERQDTTRRRTPDTHDDTTP